MRTNATTGNAAADRPADLDFDALAELEPRLRDLEDSILAIRRLGLSWRARFRGWYHEIKPQFWRLVGWHSGRVPGDPLGTRTAYDAVYQHLYNLLMARGTTPRKRRPQAGDRRPNP